MVREEIGRLVPVCAEAPHPLIGILIRGNLAAHARRLREVHDASRHIRIGGTLSRRSAGADAVRSGADPAAVFNLTGVTNLRWRVAP